MRIGLISDTHGRLDSRVHKRFDGVDEIVHAGDVCARDILIELETIAPVHAVAGNCDWGDTGHLPQFLLREHPDLRILVTHILGRGREHSPRADVAEAIEETRATVVVFGHSHRPDLQRRDGVLYVNPGSVTQARGNELGLAMLTLTDDGPRVELMDLDGAVTRSSDDV